MKIAIVISRYYPSIMEGLLRGAVEYLKEEEILISESDIYDAPGAFEIPLIAKELAIQGKYEGVICLGCVIRGETAHFEYISRAASQGLMSGMLETRIPIAFGILTAYTQEQCIKRSGDHDNKGREAAMACVQSARILRKIRTA